MITNQFLLILLISTLIQNSLVCLFSLRTKETIYILVILFSYFQNIIIYNYFYLTYNISFDIAMFFYGFSQFFSILSLLSLLIKNKIVKQKLDNLTYKKIMEALNNNTENRGKK